MSETMIERVAKAIEPNEFKWWQQRFDYEMQQSGDEIEAKAYAESFFNRAEIYAKARAAIEAMRVPTEDMMHAGWMAQYRSLGSTEAEAREMANSKILLEREKNFLSAGWSAAIDAALKEQTK